KEDVVTPAVSVRGLDKSFGGVPVLKGLTFQALPGSVVVLAGENGAGKSTLFNLLMGSMAADAGVITLRGTDFDNPSPRLARELGVAIVPQELAPYDDLSIAENVAVGQEPSRAGILLDRRAMRRHAKDLLAEFE